MTSPVQVTVTELIALNNNTAALRKQPRRPKAVHSGDYTSPLKGRGMEFDESRLYQPGDDIRNMDWRVTARTGKPHTKLFREERERPVFVWTDFRTPMFFATRGVFKAVFVARMSALIAWYAIQQGDRIGGLIFSEQEHHELKPGLGRPAVLQLINRLVKHPAWQNQTVVEDGQNNLKKALTRLNRLVRPGSLVYMLSDFRDLESNQAELARLSRHCEVVMIAVHDILEEQLPIDGTFRLSDGEQDLIINTHDHTNLEKYHQHFEQHSEFLQQLAARYRMHLITCLTTDDPVKQLSAYAH